MVHQLKYKMKSVKSINPFKSLPTGRQGVVQTIYDIVKTHSGKEK